MTAPEWSELTRQRLADQRVISAFGRLDDACVTDLAAQLWTLDAVGDDPITLLVSLEGGTVTASLALLDVLDVIGVEVVVTVVGGIVGPPVAALAGARRREAGPHARIVLRDESVHLVGSYRELEQSVRAHHEERSRLLARLADSTRGRHSLGDLLTDFERGLALTADEALAYGLIDRVVTGRSGIVSLPRPPTRFGFRPR